MPLEPESDLHWTAFLYVAGDLPPDESSSFERLLAEDQDAREAVASAVEMAQALAILGPEPTSKGRSPGRRRTMRVIACVGSLAAAACLAAMLIPATPAEPDASDVAQAWTGLRKAPDTDGTAFDDGPHSTDPGDPGQAALTDVEAEDSTGRDLPSWLLTAASAPRDEAPQEEN
jgi:hypothetical protein